MEFNKIFEDAEKDMKKTKKYLQSLSAEKRQEIKNNEEEISYKSKELIDKKEISISGISTSFEKDYLVSENEKMDAYITMFFSNPNDRVFFIVTNAKTLQGAYVLVNPYHTIPYNEFFKLD